MLTDQDFQKLKSIFFTKDDIKRELKPIREDIAEIRKNDLKPIKEDIEDIRKKMNSIISFFDREYLALRKRVELIEEQLHMSPQQ